MHKSGTTLVSQILHHSGINMGQIDTHIGYDKGNQYERVSTRALNEEILGSQNRLSIDIVAPEKLTITASQRDRMKALINSRSRAYTDWGFKDPRTTLVYPLWAEVLPQHKLIVVYRGLDELWQRYRPKLHRRYRDFKVAHKLAQRWYEHNINILNILRATPMEAIVLEFSELMRWQDEFDRFQAFVGRPLVDQRRMDLYRHRHSGHSLPLELTKWLMARKTGLDYAAILTQLDALAGKAGAESAPAATDILREKQLHV
jgi:hypothetical protein